MEEMQTYCESSALFIVDQNEDSAEPVAEAREHWRCPKLIVFIQ